MKLIRIRRFHIALALLILAAAAAVYLRHRHDRRLAAELPPMEPVTPQALHEPARPAKPKKPAARRKMVKTPQPEPKVIALTFDDGPHPGYTQRLLDILKDEHVPATFFVVGKQVKLYPELAKAIDDSGSELANHTYDHRDMRTLSPEELTQELDQTEQLVAGITGRRMRFFRPPGGQYNRQVVSEAAGLGYTMTLWTVFPMDHTNPPAEVIRRRVLTQAGDHGVILMHSGVQHTIDVLPELIETLKGQGYRFVTVSELAAQDHAPAGASPIVRTAGVAPVAPR